MFQIIGTERNGQQRLVATPGTAREARTLYNSAHPDFTAVHINGPDGQRMSIDELNRRAQAEAEADDATKAVE